MNSFEMEYASDRGIFSKRVRYRVRIWDRGDLGVWAYVYKGGPLLDVVLYKDLEEFFGYWRPCGEERR